MKDKKQMFMRGCKDAVPVMLGYFAVSFTLGIAAKETGLSAFQAVWMSVTNLTSAGEFAALGLMAAGAALLEMAVTQFIINLRYCLMSFALSQKLDPKVSLFHRLLMSYGITDEIFALAAGSKGKLHPYYVYGAVAAAAPGWALGTLFGVISGGLLPDRVLSAMSVALYGMFIAVVIPPARKSKILAGLVTVSMVASALFAYLPAVREISSGFRIIILTVLLAGAAALWFPVEEEHGVQREEKEAGGTDVKMEMKKEQEAEERSYEA